VYFMPALITALCVALVVYGWWIWPEFVGAFRVIEIYLVATLFVAVVWVVAVARRTTAIDACTAGLAIFGGLAGAFWPAIELAFQHVDGGSLRPSANVFFLAAVSLSLLTVAGGMLVPSHPRASRIALTVATAGGLLLAVVAPDAPPSARQEALFGVPVVAAAALVSWAQKH
jgi:hypothetical protein